MDLVPAELKEIADAVEQFKTFVDSQFHYTNINIEWPDTVVEFYVINGAGHVVGTIGYGDSGEIAFTPKEAK